MDTCSYDSLTVLIPHLVLILAYGDNAGMIYNCTIYVTSCYIPCGSVKIVLETLQIINLVCRPYVILEIFLHIL